MRILQFFLVMVLAAMTFMVSYVGTRLTMHRDPIPNTNQYARVVDDLVYGFTVALPASLPHIDMPTFGDLNLEHASSVLKRAVSSDANVPDVDVNVDDDSDAKLAKEQVPGVDNVAPKIAHARSVVLSGMVESEGKPLFAPTQVLALTTARASDVMIANISAAHGGMMRFPDGSYLAIGPAFLPHDIELTVSLSTPAVPETNAFDAASEAMVIAFKPALDGLAYADYADPQAHGAVAGIALSNRQRLRITGHLVTFVKRVFLRDGTSTDFEESPNNVTHVMTADLAEDHVFSFTAHVKGTIVVSLQRLKNSAVVGEVGTRL